VVCIILIRMAPSCTRDRASANACPGCSSPVSFKANIIPIFNASCALSNCHALPTNAGSLNLDSAHAYQTVTEPGTGRIDTAYPMQSILWQVLQGGSNGMPLNAQQLPACQIQLVYCWIQQGAHNN
jgi:hypothetical protein